MYKSHGETASVSKFAEEEELECCRFAQWQKDCQQAGLHNSTISTKSNSMSTGDCVAHHEPCTMDIYSETVIVNTGISRKTILLTMVRMRRSPLTVAQRVTDIKTTRATVWIIQETR